MELRRNLSSDRGNERKREHEGLSSSDESSSKRRLIDSSQSLYEREARRNEASSSKKDFLRQVCERLHLDCARDHVSRRSSQKSGAEKADHRVEAREEAPSLPDSQRDLVMLSRRNEMIPARVLKPEEQGETYAWKPLSVEEVRKSDALLLPKYVSGYGNPCYYEQLKETGSFDAEGLMGASVRLMQTRTGEQYVVKRAIAGRLYDGLRRQIERTQEMKKKGVDIIPEVVDVNIRENDLYYVMPYIKGETGRKAFFADMTDEEFLAKVDTMLSQLDQGFWSKGDHFSEEDYFSRRHLYSVERTLEKTKNVSSEEIKILLTKETFTVNDEKITNLRVLLGRIMQSTPLLDSLFETAKVSDVTHGDLHFGNILFDEAEKLHIIDVYEKKEREINAVEFEISQILFSFYWHGVLTDVEYRTMQGESGEWRLQYTKKGQKMLQRKQQAFDTIMEHPAMQKWFADKEKSRQRIELLEALHTANAFSWVPHEQQLGAYFFGTRLLEQVMRKLGLW